MAVAGGGSWGETGLLRLFNPRSAARSPGCCPAALLLGVGRPLVRPRPRAPTCVRPASCSGAAGCVVTALTFSFMAGIFHAYYTVALAPAIAALRRHRRLACCGGTATRYVASGLLAAATALTTVLGVLPAGPHADFAALAAVGRPGRRPGRRAPARRASAPCPAPRRHRRGSRRLARHGSLAGPDGVRRSTTAATPHTGSIPSAGPSGTSAGFPAAARCGGRHGLPAGSRPVGGGGTGGLLNGSDVERRDDRAAAARTPTSYTWVAAAVGSNTAAGYQLASERAGDGDRRLQRQRPEPDAGASSSSTSRTARSTGSSPAAVGMGGGLRRRPTPAARPHRDRHLGQRRTSRRTTVDGVTVYDLSGRARRRERACPVLVEAARRRSTW